MLQRILRYLYSSAQTSILGAYGLSGRPIVGNLPESISPRGACLDFLTPFLKLLHAGKTSTITEYDSPSTSSWLFKEIYGVISEPVPQNNKVRRVRNHLENLARVETNICIVVYVRDFHLGH